MTEDVCFPSAIHHDSLLKQILTAQVFRVENQRNQLVWAELSFVCYINLEATLYPLVQTCMAPIL